MPQGVQAFEMQPSLAPAQDAHALPPWPHAESAVPGRQPRVASQQPLQLPVVQPQVPLEQAKPVPHVAPQQASPRPPQGTQLPLEHVTLVPLQTLQLPPVVPQAELAVPVSQPDSSQQPLLHELALQTQLPFEQARLALQVVPQQSWPNPPQDVHFASKQDSVAVQTAQLPATPQAADVSPDSQPVASQQPVAQDAEVQPQVPPEQARPVLQSDPPQQACLFPPQAAHAPAVQLSPGGQTAQAPLAGFPQAATDVPAWQTPFASQQPEQELEVQEHLPPEQARPALQVDLPQQSWPLSPQAVQIPARHCWPAVHVVPQPPQFWPSVAVLTHSPPQSVSPARQLAEQALCEQV